MFKIPRRLDDLLPAAAVEKVLDALYQPELYQGVKDAIGKVSVKDVHPIEKMQSAWQQTRLWLDSVVREEGSGQAAKQVLNATGQLFPEGSLELPIAPVLAFGYAKAASTYRQTEVVRQRAEHIAKQCTASSEIAWLANTASAIAVFAKQSKSTEIVVARTDLLRIPGLGDINQILSLAGLPINEVGATNGATVSDWEAALTSQSQLLVLVSPNGLTHEEANQQRAAGAGAAKACGAKVLELVADGVLSDRLAESHKLRDVRKVVAENHTLCLPTHLFIGGSQGALLAGKSGVARCWESADAMGVSLRAADLAMATNAIQVHASEEPSDTGLTHCFECSVENLKNRASRIAIQLNGLGDVTEAVAVERKCSLGPRPWQNYQFDNFAVALTGNLAALQRHASQEDLSIAHVVEGDKLVLDLRFIPPQDDHKIVAAFAGTESSDQAAQTVDASE